MRLAVILISLGVIASMTPVAVAQERRRPELNPLSAPREVITYAIEKACLPLVDAGVSVTTGVGHSGVVRFQNGSPGVALFGRSEVYVQDQGALGCYLRGERLDATAMRQVVLDTLTRLGKRPRLLFDSGPESANLKGSGHRQETWCLDARQGQGFVLSTSNTRRLLQFSLMNNASRACGGT